ncbi:hypothetical protein Pan216_54880 [Planctomycetes bacterium Pan216]|uniref:PepSY-associated TM helix n=1 Tax=Kolteria novifilia TaxID=2527975 RepID=A0A518BC86_9BACT|nr:hypothetical protein Pan216_54880 [Planctomycetes bacterium Pan216]
MKSLLYRSHRWIGLVACVPILAWTVSGIAHPVMGWLSPEPAQKSFPKRPVEPSELTIGLREALEKQGVEEITWASLVPIEDRTFYQVGVPGTTVPRYFDAATGDELVNGDVHFAELLARHFVGDQTSSVTDVGVVTSFDQEYRPIFQFLPARRVLFGRDDNMRAYVDTRAGRLGMLVDRTRGNLLGLFSCLHNWEFVGLPEVGRVAMLLAFSLFVFAGALSGLLVYGLMWRRLGMGAQARTPRGRLRKFHRLAGLSVSGIMLLFAFSGGYHALKKLDPQLHGFPLGERRCAVSGIQRSPKEVFELAEETGPVRDLQLVVHQGEPHYLVSFVGRENVPNPKLVHATSGLVIDEGDIAHAKDLATRLDGIEVATLRGGKRLPTFLREYSPVNKRIPVVRVDLETSNNRRLYVDPKTGVVATSMDDSVTWERLSFLFLHKWHFLDPLGMGSDARNGAMVVATASCALVTALGLALLVGWFRPKLRAKRSDPVLAEEEAP